MYDIGSLRNAWLSSAVVALAVFAGCETTVMSGSDGGAGGAGTSSSSSSSSSSGTAGMGGSGGDGGMGGSGGVLPACESGNSATLAVDQMFFGDVDADGTSNPVNGWKQFGFNLDGRVSTQTSTDLCQPTAGGSKSAAYPDGIAGIDNSFGKNILPILLGLAGDVTTINNEAIDAGDYTYLFSLAHVGQVCMTSSALFLGGNLGATPKFDGSDIWPIDVSSLLDPTKPDSAKCAFPMTRLEASTVTAGPPSQFDFVLNIADFKLVLPVKYVRTSLAVSVGGEEAKGGQIGGIIRTEDLVKEIAKVGPAFDEIFCDPQSPTVQSILDQIRQASDIMQDGTQDPTKECDGISIGLGFTMKAAKFGAVVPPVGPPMDPCMP